MIRMIESPQEFGGIHPFPAGELQVGDPEPMVAAGDLQAVFAIGRYPPGESSWGQFEFLKNRHCARFQGYHFHRPQHHREWLAALAPPDFQS